MNKSKKEITVYHGLGGVCLLGFVCSTLSSIPSWLNYFNISSKNPAALESLESQIGQRVQVASKVFSDSPQVFSISRKTEKAFADFPNFEQNSEYREFFLDKDQKIVVVPTEDTLWQTYYTTKIKYLSIKDSLLCLLSLPLHIFRYFLGLRFSNGEITTQSALKSGDNVFIVGMASLFAGRIEITPELVSVSKQAYLKLLKSENIKLIWVPILFLLGSVFCYFKVKRIEKNLESNNKIIAVADMKCKVCNSNQACVVVKPCNHLCVCETCDTGKCPVCGKVTNGSIKVFSG